MAMNVYTEFILMLLTMMTMITTSGSRRRSLIHFVQNLWITYICLYKISILYYVWGEQMGFPARLALLYLM